MHLHLSAVHGVSTMQGCSTHCCTGERQHCTRARPVIAVTAYTSAASARLPARMPAHPTWQVICTLPSVGMRCWLGSRPTMPHREAGILTEPPESVPAYSLVTDLSGQWLPEAEVLLRLRCMRQHDALTANSMLMCSQYSSAAVRALPSPLEVLPLKGCQAHQGQKGTGQLPLPQLCQRMTRQASGRCCGGS